MKYYTSTALLLDNQNQLDLSCISDAVLKESASLLYMCHQAGDCNKYVFGI